jgi:ribonuclease HI
MDIYSYFTDGAATMVNKNGKYLRQEGGWAFVMCFNGEKHSYQSGGCKLTTNNEMELYAIYASMRDFLDRSADGDKIEIYTDSGYCIGIFTQWAKNWERRGWKKSNNKPIENLTLIKAIWKLMKEIDEKNGELLFVKVKGHSNNVLNNEADELAVKAKNVAGKTGKTIGYNSKPDSLLGTK